MLLIMHQQEPFPFQVRIKYFLYNLKTSVSISFDIKIFEALDTQEI